GAASLLLAAIAAGLSLLLRPVLLGLAVAAALAGVARAELPATDPRLPVRAAALAGLTVVAGGEVVDDPRPAAGGYEVLFEPRSMRAVTGPAVAPAGDLLVRARGPASVAYGDHLEVTGRLRLPDEQPGFDRRAYLAQRQVYLELA